MATALDTKNRIIACTNQLLKKKPISKITVSEICKKINISRSTFYTHFSDVYDIYNWEWHFYLKKYLSNIGKEYDYQEGNRRLFVFMSEHPNLFLYTEDDKLNNSQVNKSAVLVKQLLLEIIKRKDAHFYASLNQEGFLQIDYLTYLNACATHKWVEDQMNVPPQQLATFINRLVPKWLDDFLK